MAASVSRVGDRAARGGPCLEAGMLESWGLLLAGHCTQAPRLLSRLLEMLFHDYRHPSRSPVTITIITATWQCHPAAHSSILQLPYRSPRPPLPLPAFYSYVASQQSTPTTPSSRRSCSYEALYARSVELSNGRAAMLGFLAAILVEAGTGNGILGQLIMWGKISGLLGAASGF